MEEHEYSISLVIRQVQAAHREIIHNNELLASRLIEQEEGSEPKKNNRRSSAQYKEPRNFKLFGEGIGVKLVKVLNTSPGQVFNQIKDRNMFDPPRKVVRDMGRLKPNTYCYYHKAIGLTRANAGLLLRQLWKLYKDERLDEFVKRLQGKKD